MHATPLKLIKATSNQLIYRGNDSYLAFGIRRNRSICKNEVHNLQIHTR